MGRLVGLGLLILLVAVVDTMALNNPSINIDTQCLGNVMRVDIGPLGRKLLEVSAVINNSAVVLTPTLASQCGFSLTTQPGGNAFLYASLQNCFAHNLDDKSFTTRLNVRLYGNGMADDELYQVAETCHYTTWASREIICGQNYMEVSVSRANPEDYPLPNHPISADKHYREPRQTAEKQPIDAGFSITTLVFFTPEQRAMKATEAQSRGYGISNTPTRLFLRSPTTSPETYTQNVAGVPMLVLKTSTIFEKKWLSSRVNAEVACPIPDGSVSFTPQTISWFLPKHIDPLVSSSNFKLLEVHVGVNGERLDVSESAARGFTVTVNDVHVVVGIPVGAVGGYFKSHVKDGQYFTTYTIEPMLELVWTEDSTYEDTRYKVFLPITTPLLSQPPQVTDNTVPEEKVFKVQLGPFNSDVALKDLAFPSEVLSIMDAKIRGFTVLEHTSPDSNSKVFSIEVPFTDHAVQQRREMGFTTYSLQLTFGLVILPEFTAFFITTNHEAKLLDIVSPSISGGCDGQNFYMLVKYGTLGFNFQTIVGKRILTSGLAQQYGFMENGTHFSFTVPFTSRDVVIEAVESESIKSRLDVTLRNPATTINIKEFSVVCNFVTTLTECFPNGTITALAVKLESVPGLSPHQLTLRDPTCGPTFSNDQYAYFVFNANSCGTTRKFFSNMMLYENEISLPDELEVQSQTDQPEYELKVSCYFDINVHYAVAYNTRPRRSEPYAETARGVLTVDMRLATDNSYSTVHRVGDGPIVKYLGQPLYFEAELKSRNPDMSLEVVNCWATLEEDRTLLPKWDLVINGCPNLRDPNSVIFHPVFPDSRVQDPSKFKRFEVLMFAFARDKDNLTGQVFVHCDMMVCDARNPVAGACNGQCSNSNNALKGQKRAVEEDRRLKHVSSGPILFKLKV